MKKILLCVFAFVSIQIKSQSLILTQSFNEPVIGDTNYTYAVDTSAYTAGLPINVTGGYTTWDFTRLGVLSTTAIPSAYVSPSVVPNSANYPGCTMAQKQGTSYTFFKSATTPTTQTEVLGLNTSTISFNFTNTAVAYKYPMSYGSSFSDNLSGSFTFSVNGTCTGSVSSNVDGFGNLFLPNGAMFLNALRAKSVQSLSLSASLVSGLPASQVGTLKQTTYSYFHASQKFPVLTIDYTKVSLITSSTPTIFTVVSTNSKSFIVGTKENALNEADYDIFPNPSSGLINITSSIDNKPKKIEIYSALSELIYQSAEIENINISALAEGIYFLKITGDQGSVIKKIIKQD